MLRVILFHHQLAVAEYLRSLIKQSFSNTENPPVTRLMTAFMKTMTTEEMAKKNWIKSDLK